MSRQTLSANQRRFAFAGDSHVYLYDLFSYRLEKILPFCEVSVTHIQLSTAALDLIACVLMDNSVQVWNVQEERLDMKH